MYSLPYNGTDVDWFLQEAEKRKKHLDHIFLDIPLPVGIPRSRGIFYRVGDVGSYARMFDHISSCAVLLGKSKGRFRRICTLNAMYYMYGTAGELFAFVKDICDAVDKYAIDGLIVTDYRIAKALHTLRPEVEIHTSCNAYQWSITQMEIWREVCGVKVFNPPREILRVPSKLKEMHDAGFGLKCLVNESCLIGCPNSFNHSMSIALRCLGILDMCCQRGVGDILRGNYIVPRWQKHYDRYVDIYKIAGRDTVGDYPFKCMDAYLREEDKMVLSDLILGGTVAQFKRIVPDGIRDRLTLDRVPDKLLSCECKGCSECGLCDRLMKSFVPKEYWDRFYSTRYEIVGKEKT